VQVLEERVQHLDASLSAPEEYYQPTGREVQPKPVGEEAGQVVFQYYPVSAVNYVSVVRTKRIKHKVEGYVGHLLLYYNHQIEFKFYY
jgi:4-amino-4-deoxy-L-arabinose transferase-like glycosyltransferase